LAVPRITVSGVLISWEKVWTSSDLWVTNSCSPLAASSWRDQERWTVKIIAAKRLPIAKKKVPLESQSLIA
jgi:hypothetical protein